MSEYSAKSVGLAAARPSGNRTRGMSLFVQSLLTSTVLVVATPVAAQEPTAGVNQTEVSEGSEVADIKADIQSDDGGENDASASGNVGKSIITAAPITVTATRQERTLLETAGNVDTVTKEEIQKIGDVTVRDIFRYKAGIEVPVQSTGTDPFNSNGGIEIRGVGGNRTQVLVDGNRTLERITDNTRDVVEASNIKAVEIVRGPSSVLWGSDALGGVVNFITRDPADLLGPDDIWAGDSDFSYNALDNAFVETLTGAVRVTPDISILGSYTRRDAEEVDLANARDGLDAIQPCPRPVGAQRCDGFDPSDTSSNNYLAKVVFEPNDHHLFRLTGEYFERETEVSQNSVLGVSGANNTLSYERKQETTRWRATLAHEWYPSTDYLDELSWSVTYSPQQNKRTGVRIQEAVATGVRTQLQPTLDYKETFWEADIQATSSVEIANMDHVFTYGFDGDFTKTEYEREDITTNLATGVATSRRAGGFNFANAETTRADIYLQDEISFFDGSFKIIPGVRGAYYKIDPDPDADYRVAQGAEPRTIEEYDVQFKLGTIAELGGPWSVYANYGQGFKMPTAQQLFQSIDSSPFFALVPNPNLKPESVDSFELGVRLDFEEDGYFSINGFNSQYDEFIQNFVSIDPVQFGLPAALNTLTYDNVDKVRIWGIEAEGYYGFTEDFYTWFNVSHQKGTQKNNGVKSEFLDALPLKWVQAVGFNDEETGINLELVGTFQLGDQKVNNRTTQFQPEDYFIMDALGRWDVTENVSVRAGVHNIFDRRYFAAESRGFPINGRANVQRVNPIELQVQPGRYGTVGVSFKF